MPRLFPLPGAFLGRIATISAQPPMQSTSAPDVVSADRVAELLDRWRSLAAWVDLEMEKCLGKLGEDCPERLRSAVKYSLLAPGKRLRPVLAILGCEAVGGDRQQALPAALALEMIHCYSLIHDDLPAMDDDDLRRGRPTCHVEFDEATAILAGDALQPLAFEVLASSVLPADVVQESCRLLARAAGGAGMVGGQMDDLLAEKRDASELSWSEQAEWLTSIHRRKTGALIEAAVVLGAVAGRASASQRDRLKEYGRAIGLVFQIVDDLLDVESSPENTGKATGKDRSRGKLTYPDVHGIEASRGQARECVQTALAALDVFGERAQPLRDLSSYLLTRST